MIRTNNIRQQLLLDCILFGIPTILLFICTKLVIPFVNLHYNISLIYCWYLFSSILVFIPMFITALYFKPRGLTFLSSFRIKGMTKRDFGYSLFGIIGISVLTMLLLKVMEKLIPGFSPQPDFMKLEPTGTNYGILLAWLPMFFFNIIGEGIYWRGIVYPIQERHYGAYTWIIHGVFWSIFHLAFGLKLMIILFPILFIIPFVIQQTKNTTNDIIIHAMINGVGFISIAFGII